MAERRKVGDDRDTSPRLPPYPPCPPCPPLRSTDDYYRWRAVVSDMVGQAPMRPSHTSNMPASHVISPVRRIAGQYHDPSSRHHNSRAVGGSMNGCTNLNSNCHLRSGLIWRYHQQRQSDKSSRQNFLDHCLPSPLTSWPVKSERRAESDDFVLSRC